MEEIIIFTGYYIPGYKGGGPIKSIQSIAEGLQNYKKIYIVTADRDLGDNKPYDNIKINEWNDMGNYKILYLDSTLSFYSLIDIMKKQINGVECKVYYLNGVFNFKYSILPLILIKIGVLKRANILIAPRGELDKGALSIKSLKKRIFINIFNFFNLYKYIRWHATSDQEIKDIEREIKGKKEIFLVENASNVKNVKNISTKEVKTLRLVFLSRITPKKNLDYALDILLDLNKYISNRKIIFDIYGTLEDKEYWSNCQQKIKKITGNIKVKYKGVLDPSNISKVLPLYNAFFFPTKGENFGHVIVEALSCGLQVILSDNTPWNDVEENNAGWAINLNNRQEFMDKIIYLSDLNEEEFYEKSKSCFSYLSKKLNTEDILKKTNDMFSESID